MCVCACVCVCVCGGAWGVIFPLHCWFSFNYSETVKAITLEICGIQELFIRNIWAKRGIPNFSQSPDIEQNLDARTLIYDQFRVIWKPDSRYMVYKIDIFNTSNFHLIKTKKKN